MVSGEFVSMTTLHSAIPDATPAPIAWGTYSSDPDTHFFLCNFIDMTDEIPNPQIFTSKVAEFHTKGISPNGKYGFPVPTFMGKMPQYTTWTDSWEEFFTNAMRKLMSVIEGQEDPDPEFRQLFETVLEKVVPRLLRPLETGGRHIRPRLVHGDLYSGNVSVDTATGAPILYDATCLYAHNECK
jgi:protein-ribulosamine 3-kinase